MKTIRIISLFMSVMTEVAIGQWTQQQSGVTSNLFGVWFTSPSNGIAIGQYGKSLRTNDGGETWSQLQNLSNANLNKICFVDNMRGWMVGDDNTILSTTDGGNTWHPETDDSPYFAHYYGIFCRSSKEHTTCWLCGGRNYTGLTVIEKSSGDGQWYPQVIAFAGRLVRIFFIDDSLGWAVGDSNLILTTTDGGRWWNKEKVPALPPFPYHQGFNDVKFFDSQTGLCTGDGGVIMKTTDGGTDWRVISDTGGVLFKIALVRDSVAYLVGSGSHTGGGAIVMKSTDRGDTWTTQQIDSPPGSWLEDIYFASDTEGWAVGGGGLILHTNDAGDTHGNDNDSGADSSSNSPGYSLRQNYPNPFNPTTTIAYDIPKGSHVTIFLYDMLGRKVATLIDENKDAGTYKVVFDGTRFASGVYLYRIQAGNYTSTRKLLLMK